MSFAVTLSLFPGVLLAVILCWCGFVPWLLCAVGCAGALLLAQLIALPLAGALYDLWNRLARRCVRPLRIVIAGICYFVVVAVVGLAVARLEVRKNRQDPSQWRAKGTLPPRQYASTFAGEGIAGRCWIRSYLRWSVESGNLWAVALLPFLVLLAWLGEEEEAAFPANIYTLF